MDVGHGAGEDRRSAEGETQATCRQRSPGRTEQLIADLNRKQFSVREAATKALERLGFEAEVPLRAALDSGTLSLEAQRRVRNLLDAENFVPVDRRATPSDAGTATARNDRHGEGKGGVGDSRSRSANLDASPGRTPLRGTVAAGTMSLLAPSWLHVTAKAFRECLACSTWRKGVRLNQKTA